MIQTEQWHGVEVYKIESNDLACWICPSVGGNLFRIKDKKEGLDLLRTPSSPDQLKKNSVFYGTPVLFPPNRLSQGRFIFDGRVYQFPINTPEGNHIHGFLKDSSWRFETLTDAYEVNSLTLSLDLIDFPEILDWYPHHLKFQAKFTVHQKAITQEILVTNKSNERAPIGAGLHTWFHLAGGYDTWDIRMPFERIWELGDDVMPTEKFLEGETLSQLKIGSSLKGNVFDTIFFRGSYEPLVELTRRDGYRITYRGSEEIMHWVLHTPSDESDVLAVEPYTWVTNAPNLRLAPEVTGLSILSPGETFQCALHLSIDYAEHSSLV